MIFLNLQLCKRLEFIILNFKSKKLYFFDNMLIYLLKKCNYYLEFRNYEVEIIQNVQHDAMHLYMQLNNM